jgi:hypothetical protein
MTVLEEAHTSVCLRSSIGNVALHHGHHRRAACAQTQLGHGRSMLLIAGRHRLRRCARRAAGVTQYKG